MDCILHWFLSLVVKTQRINPVLQMRVGEEEFY